MSLCAGDGQKGGVVLNKYLKTAFIAIGLLLAGAAVLVMTFIIEMTPDKDEEEKVIAQAEEYLQSNFKDGHYEIYDTLYDNMGNYGYFDYAALVRNKDNNQTFKVYFNKETEKMEDSLTVEKQDYYINNEIKPALVPYIQEKFGDTAESSIHYSISEEKPAITVRLSKAKEDRDKELFSNLVTYIKEELNLEHAHISMFYTDEDEEYIWNEVF